MASRIGPEGQPIAIEGKEGLDTKTRIMVAGYPGKMATLVAEAIRRSDNCILSDVGLSSQNHFGTTIDIEGKPVALKTTNFLGMSESNPRRFFEMVGGEGIIVVDYTTPTSVNSNAEAYVKARFPFVMGTTGGDRERLLETVRNSEICAVIAPNMAVEVVRVQQTIETLAQNAPGLLNGWLMRIKESHQSTKKDVSGTAIAFQRQLERLGVVMEREIEYVRDQEIQERELGVPHEHLGGHAYHWITLESPDGVSKIEFETKINGRQPYVDGTFMALKFLQQKMEEGAKGQAFTMVNVLHAQATQ